MQIQNNLIRRHYLVSESNIQKVATLSKIRNCSAAEIVRSAIDAYDIHQVDEESELHVMLDLVEQSLATAIQSTRSANRRVAKVLKRLEDNARGSH